MLIPLPQVMRNRVADPRAPAATRDASTTVLMREGTAGTEVFLMRRKTTLPVAPGCYVFPGGGVHELDSEPIPWSGNSPQEFADRFRCTVSLARALVVAAARETFEETGVLLAGPDQHSIVSDLARYRVARLALERHELTFAQFLRQQRLVLRADLLAPWARWITPVTEPRRYDTRFFLAVLPPHHTIGPLNDEADDSIWMPLAEVSAARRKGALAMLPPTVAICDELASHTLTELFQATQARTIRPVQPRIVKIDGSFWLDTGHDPTAAPRPRTETIQESSL